MFVHLYVRIHSQKLVDYLYVQADNQWYNYYLLYQYLWENPSEHKGIKSKKIWHLL